METPKWKGTPIYNYHNPRNLLNGGYVYKKQNMTRRQIHHDSIHGILKPGEIVIPVKYKGKPLASMMKRFLINNNIRLPNF